MKNLVIILISLIMFSCGFKPIYGSKNSNFEIIEIINENENKNSFAIEKMVMTFSKQGAVNKVKLEMSYKQTFSTILKDNKGDPSKKKLSISVNLIVKNEKDNVLTNKNFREIEKKKTKSFKKKKKKRG